MPDTPFLASLWQKCVSPWGHSAEIWEVRFWQWKSTSLNIVHFVKLCLKECSSSYQFKISSCYWFLCKTFTSRNSASKQCYYEAISMDWLLCKQPYSGHLQAATQWFTFIFVIVWSAGGLTFLFLHFCFCFLFFWCTDLCPEALKLQLAATLFPASPWWILTNSSQTSVYT